MVPPALWPSLCMRHTHTMHLCHVCEGMHKRRPSCCRTPPHYQMVLNTSPDVGDLREAMAFIYDELFVEYVVRNPLYVPGQPFK